VQKLLYTVLMATRKLLHYFTDHEVAVVTSFPSKTSSATATPLSLKLLWIKSQALKLMGHDIRYIPCTAIKSQDLMDFVVEWTEVLLPTLDVTHEYWTMYFDRSVMALCSRDGVVLIS